MDCSNYDPDQCTTGGVISSGDGLTLERMPVLRETWLPSGLALAFVLPVVFRVRRRKGGDKQSKEQKNDIQ
jgi:hypothetical protein